MAKTINVHASLDQYQLVETGGDAGLSDDALQLFRHFTEVPLELKVADDGEVVGCKVTQAFPENEPSVVTCVYCGHEYPEGTPTAKHELLTSHIKICEKHPLRAAEEAVAKLRGALMDFIGVETLEELDAMELAIRSLPGPEEDKAVSINAIHALKDTAPDPFNQHATKEGSKCPVCKGVGEIGIPGGTCRWCNVGKGR